MSIRDAVCHELENICKTGAYSVDYFRQILFRIQQKVLPPVLLVSPFRNLLWLPRAFLLIYDMLSWKIMPVILVDNLHIFLSDILSMCYESTKIVRQ